MKQEETKERVKELINQAFNDVKQKIIMPSSRLEEIAEKLMMHEE